MEDLYKTPVTITMERYQDLLENEVIVQIIAQARDTFSDYSFAQFVETLFPKTPEDSTDEHAG